ncbi:MAG: ABC transporter substrate-binding protein, partial [Thalassospira sp.]|nr:ABC transporter substrate-binding protein [Thalassospira sp.]
MRKLSQMLVFMVLVLIGPMPAQAETITVTDIAGREVAVNVPIKRAILGEGRQLYIIAALDRENPAARIVGWRKDLIEADPATYQAYLAKFPEFADIPAFEGLEQSLIDIETTIAQKPDIVFLNLETKRAVEEAAYIEKLGALDIPVVYVDFRNSPEVNTEPSIRLFGKLFGKQDRAEEFIAFRAEEIAKITNRLASVKPDRPKVFIDRAAGFYEDCCHSFGDGNFGAMVEMAGGDNIAKDLIP